MLIKTKLGSIFAIFTIFLVIAARCGAPAVLPAGGTAIEAQNGQAEEIGAKVMDLSPVSLAEGEKLQVVATTNIVADMVRNVGGDLIDLETMLPLGSDPHTFVPTPHDVTTVADAQVVFINGLNLEEFLSKLIKNAGGEVIIVPVSSGVKTHQFGEVEGDEHGQAGREHEGEEHRPDEDEESHETNEDEPESSRASHHHQGVDPHIWMSPAKAIVMVHNIEHALSALDPANAESYEANAQAYEVELEELDAWVKSQIDSIPVQKRKMVSNHNAFSYYVDRYGLELIGAVVPAYSTNAEPSAQELASLQDAISKFDVKAVFVGFTVNPTLAERLAEDTGVQLIALYTGSLGEDGSGAETYIDLIRYNTTAIVEALQ